MSDIFTPIMTQLGFGGIGGFFVGYLLKKALKFALIIGAFAFGLTYLAYENSIQIDYTQLISSIEALVTPAWNFINPLISQIPALGSLVLGVVLGFTIG
ncbi:FUN14 domain-containing protein [Thermoproteota archaeon]